MSVDNIYISAVSLDLDYPCLHLHFTSITTVLKTENKNHPATQIHFDDIPLSDPDLES